MLGIRSDGLSESVIVCAARIGIVAAALMVSACASKRAPYQASGEYNVASPDVRVAGYRKNEPSVALEDDGIAGQTPPVRRRNNQPDDPREPFSPNYGSIDIDGAANAGDTADVDVGTGGYDPFLDGPQWDHYKDKARRDAALRAEGERTRLGSASNEYRAGAYQ